MNTQKGFSVNFKTLRPSLLSLLFVMLFLAACSTNVPEMTLDAAAFQDCNRVVSGNRTGLLGTTHAMAHDGNTASSFKSSWNDWQYIQIDLGCTVTLYQVRRYMTTNGANTTGSRVLQGEGFSYSVDGITWTNLLGTTTTGWSSYVNYAPQAWHTVNYGWSNWLRLKQAQRVRYVRFNWDGNSDAVNEIEMIYRVSSAEIKSRLDLNKCVDVADGSTQDGTAVNLFGCHNGLNQRWMITSPGEIRSRLGNVDKCLDVPSGNTQDGTLVQLFTCNGGLNQKWSLTPKGEIRSQLGNKDKCLDVPSSNTQNGTRLQIFTCHGGTNQNWLIRRR